MKHILQTLFNRIPRLAAVFSDGRLWCTGLLIVQLWYFTFTRKTLWRGREMKFSLRYAGNDFTIYLNAIVDLAVLEEVFLFKEYAWTLPSPPQVIIDLGAHLGDTALYYHFTYPEAQIFAVEPAPETYARLCKNVASIPNITPIQAGIADRGGYADLHLIDSSIGNSFRERGDGVKTISVPVYNLDSLFRVCGISRADLIKFDIEGAEELLFVNATPLQYADAYIGEVHQDLMRMQTDEFLAQFADYETTMETASSSKRFIFTAIKKELR